MHSIDSSPASAALSRVPFGEFLHLLRRHGFTVGLQHYARVMTVLDRLGPECEPRQIRTVLCPVVATTAEQQDRFYRLFDQWFPLFGEISGEERVPRAATAGAGEAEAEPPAPRAPVRRRSLLIPVAVGAAVMLAVLAWFLIDRGSPQPPSSVTAPSVPPPIAVPPAGEIAPPTLPETPPTPSWRRVSRPAVQLVAIMLIVAGFVAFEFRVHRRRRIVLERQRRERPPLVWPIRVESVANPLVESSDFYTAARRLRERQTGERSRLDIEGTIAATIRSLGFPVLQYVLETRPPEYLVLIERASARDHQSRLYQHLIGNLAAEGVHTTVYWYDDDPRICEPVAGGSAAMLSELRRKYSTYRVLLFGTGEGLIDPITGRRKPWVAEALNWPDRALLTPEPVEMWGAREIALASHLVVLPASISGLQAAIDHFQMPTRQTLSGPRRASRGVAIPELTGNDHVRLLRRHIGERGLQWVCACAVYPELQWNLTLHLGMLPELGNRTIDDELLLKLVRLPWFRTGLIPDDARAILLRVIRPEVERAARGALISLLERNPAPAETIASSRYELDLVVQKLALLGPGRVRRRELARIAQRMPRDRVMRELAVVRLTEDNPVSRLAMRLPGRLRHVFFQSGMPVFGLTTGARSLVAFALIGSVVLAGRERVSAPQASLTAQQSGDSFAVPVSLAGGSARTSTARPDTLGRDSTTPAATVVAGPPVAGSATTSARPMTAAVGNVRDTATDRQISRLAPSPAPGAVATPAATSPSEQVAGRDSASIRIGSRTPDAMLYIDGAVEATVATPRSIQVRAGVPVQLSIRAVGCQPWDTTVNVTAGSDNILGSRNALCPDGVSTDSSATAALLQRAVSNAKTDLSGSWESLAKVPGLEFVNAAERQRFAALLRDYEVSAEAFNISLTVGQATVTANSALVDGGIVFQWRDAFGANRRMRAATQVTFVRSGDRLELRRVLLRLQGGR